MDSRLLLAPALTGFLAPAASAKDGEGKGPKPETITDKCAQEAGKQDKWDGKKHRSKDDKPGHWAQVCAEPPPPPPGF